MNTPMQPGAATATAVAEATGTLRVALGTQSMQFNRTAPVEIRDENMALVQRIESGAEVALPPGLYQVSAVLQDGAEYRRIAKVEAGGTCEVTLDSGTARAASAAAPERPALVKRIRAAMPASAAVAAPPPPMPAPPPQPRPEPVGALPPIMARPSASRPTPTGAAPPDVGSIINRTMRVLKRVVRPAASTAASQSATSAPPPSPQPAPPPPPAPTPPPPPPPPASSEPALVSLQGAQSLRQLPDGWFLTGEQGVPAGIPTAEVRVGDTTWRVSLPLNPGQGDCTVQVAPANTRLPVTAWIAPDRTMTAALQNMLLNGEYEALAPVADQAIELLRSKYQDPTGAALGALILHKVGKLSTYVAWLENLARDFPWIPDGDVLLASMLVQEHRELDRALQLAVSAAQRRMLLSESYSILLDMLRRWPDRAAIAPHRAIVEDVARRGAYVAWGSLFFCHAGPG